MPDETKDVNELARDVVAAAFEEPVAVTGYLLIATAVDQNGDDRWMYKFDPNTPEPLKLALARIAQFLSDDIARTFLAPDEPDDEQ